MVTLNTYSLNDGGKLQNCTPFSGHLLAVLTKLLLVLYRNQFHHDPFQVHQKQTERMRHRSEWFLSDPTGLVTVKCRNNNQSQAWLPDGYSRIFRIVCVWPSGL